MHNHNSLVDLTSAKKITYILFVPESTLLSPDKCNQLRTTINSVLTQSVPFCDFLIISTCRIIAQLTKIIDRCILKSLSIIQKKIDKEGSTPDVENDLSQTVVSSLNPYVYLYESPKDNFDAALDTVKNILQTDWIVFLNYSTHVASHANYEFMGSILRYPDSVLIYADHDLVDNEGQRSQPVFKPSFSLDLFYSQNYIGSFFAIKTNHIKGYQSLKKYHSFSNFTFAIILNLIEEIAANFNLSSISSVFSCKIIHLPTVLNSNRKKILSPKAIAGKSTEQLRILRDHLNRCYSDVLCAQIKPFIYRHKWPIDKITPLVSLIVPTKDGYDILKACIDSIIKKTIYKNYEIIIVDNQTSDKKTLSYLNHLTLNYDYIRIIKYENKFNYSDINNLAVKYAEGKVLGFLNNDIEIISPEWLTEMVSHAIRPDVGCVGALHYYPDMHIQHAGVIVGMHGVADHAFKGLKKSSRNDQFGYLYSIRNPDAVTAATLLVRRELFDLVGGFDSEYLKIAFNDVDLCLKIIARGYRCVWTPYAELFHHESKTRNTVLLDEVSMQVELAEHRVMRERWLTDRYLKRDLLRSIDL